MPRRPADGARPRILESFRRPRPTTNPYLMLLMRALTPWADVVTFSWPRALFGHYDALHVHWPDVVADRKHPVRSVAASAMFALVLVRCRLGRIAIVRTAHNPEPHEASRPWVAAVSALCDRWTTWWIRLNDSTVCPGPVTTIVHGHYRDWYEPSDEEAVPGRMLSFGLLRPYKGIEGLLSAFAALEADGVSLRLAGRPTTPALADEVARACALDERLSARLEHIPDADLVSEIARASLVVLPYRAMHNSGAVLLALSLGRPVLVPSNAVTDALADEVGHWWVQRFGDELSPDVLRAALEAVSSGPPALVDLTARQWPEIGAQHAATFTAAIAAARGRGRRSARGITATGPRTSSLRVALVGTRGVPARYGGFETAVEEVGRRLAERGHDVVVYCRPVAGEPRRTTYLGMRLVHLPVVRRRSLETLVHTALSVVHVATHRVDAVVLFNAANSLLLPVLRSTRLPVATHVDGLEWRRAKWGPNGRRYYRLAESLAVRWSDALIADAQGIADYYRAEFGAPTRLIAYGAPQVGRAADRLGELDLTSRGYHLVVARFEPENHVDVIVAGYARSAATLPLVVVGSAPYSADYTARVHAAADGRVRFLGAVWDADLLDQLFANALTYLHGHSVGGTNPALLRAIGAGAPTIAYDVSFNREVLGVHGEFFVDADAVAARLVAAESDPEAAIERGERLRVRARDYDWDDVTRRYEDLVSDLAARRVRRPRLSGRRRRGGNEEAR